MVRVNEGSNNTIGIISRRFKNNKIFTEGYPPPPPKKKGGGAERAPEKSLRVMVTRLKSHSEW